MRPLAMNTGISSQAKQRLEVEVVSADASGSTLWTLLSPVVLILTSFLIFLAAKTVASERIAQLTGFAYYWTVGGIIIPLVLLQRDGYAALFQRSRVSWNARLVAAVIAVLVPAAFGFLFAFPFLFPLETAWLLPGLALYALLNGTLEEAFWRGLFITRFRSNPWLGVVYPGMLFGVWQLALWGIFDFWFRPSWLLVLLVAVATGLLYGWIAWRMRSIRWTVIAHVLTNLSGVGALVLFA